MTESIEGGKKNTATTTDASGVNQELTSGIAEDAVLRREGIDCEFYYREQNGTLVERAVFDDGHIGGVYQAGHDVDPESDDVDVLEPEAWPTRDDDFDTGAPVIMTDGGGFDITLNRTFVRTDDGEEKGIGKATVDNAQAYREMGGETAAGALHALAREFEDKFCEGDGEAEELTRGGDA